MGSCAYTAAAHICFICDNKRRSYRIKGLGGFLIVIADSGDYGADLLRRHIQIIQQTERHNCAALGMVNAVHDISDIVKIGGYHSKLGLPWVAVKSLHYHPDGGCNFFYMGKGMLGIALRRNGCVGILYIGSDIGIAFYIFICDIT